MIFVDTNVFMYAVGRSHPLQDPAQDFFGKAADSNLRLFTSAEVLQELMHVYEATGRMNTFAVAMELVNRSVAEVWPLEKEDVDLARQLYVQYPALSARDLCHLACCRRRGISRIKTFDQVFLSVAGKPL
ncbi:MAG: type II toxin-antitoxin system VapC family toxin [Chloroflexi bacterium]|nr:type II toxin-antitoxin system VapC family toxin [Chloroflexota bacterium]